MKDSKKDSPEIRNPKSEAQDPEPGTLYVTSTPIGNLEDITLRALSVLKSVDVIAAEKVAHTRGLLEHYGIKTRLTSYNQHNQKVKANELIQRLTSGRDAAVVTDAGTPGISDPGAYLISRAANENIEVVPIPGPSAVIAALSVSGMPTEEFVFCGFLPNKSGKRKKALRRLVPERRTMVFFEAPHRIEAMLIDLKEILGDRQMVMLKEMTKVFEEVKRATVSAILTSLTPDRIKGEFTLVVAGNEEEEPRALCEEVLEKIEELLSDDNMGVKDIAELISREEDVAYRQVYKACLAKKRSREDLRWGELVKKLKIRNNLGLHARAAGKIVELANQHESRLFLQKDDEEVDGSSILSILTLSCPKGTEIQARIVGRDSESFMKKLGELFEQKFGEGK
ncbi:MAG: 16S rRNA (cytidine(1402)-2'-O)-methyltransferase [Deltaproteobacteria bacterium]|nr:16S rRNA (cytidine(1402)-2'-O)-methyltransferase [Deltaproteobacteria bacterium]MBW2344752.1 16S rRNA (cytidine(1402)-2'-O)-methyltransferase [Deltaproteobacteria bacterium]